MNEKMISTTIIETLERDGALKEDALYKAVKKLHGGLEKGLFEKNLMVMELQGLVRVYRIPRGKRKIEIVRRRG
ncbi:MAG TPA: hypothetical protein VM050_11445 [Patescibacteria group bacterium]|nr:hypothetical protein [Patescibacteria group bacterium]